MDKIVGLEDRIKSLPANDAESLDAFVGKSISISLADSRDWKIAILSAVLNEAIAESSESQWNEAIISICEKLEPRHILLLNAINTITPDDNDRVSYDRLQEWVEQAASFDSKLLWLSVSDLIQMCLITSMNKSKGEVSILIGISLTGVMYSQAFKMTGLGSGLIGYLSNFDLSTI